MMSLSKTKAYHLQRFISLEKNNAINIDFWGYLSQFKCIYIGETERTLKKRLNEHKRDSSHVGQDLGEHKQRLHKEVKILDKDSRWLEGRCMRSHSDQH